MHRDIILEAISKMSFKDSIQFFVETLSIHAANKSDDNFFLCHTFKSYLKEHLEEFKNQITKNETLKDNLKKLFELNTYIYDDNLISIIIDDKNSAELIEILNENVDFEKYYLNDNIMSFITPENKSIFEKLKGNNRKYVFSITNSITIPEEEQKKVYDKVLSELPQKFIDNLFLFNNVIRENTPNEFERYTEINKAIFSFNENVINKPDNFYIYLYNVNKIFGNNLNEKNYYNTFLISIKYPEIHEQILSTKIDNDDIYNKLKVLTTLPILKGIITISDLNKISISEMYQLDMEKTASSINPGSADASGDYQYEIFDYNREVIKISDDEVKSVQVVDYDLPILGASSHIEGLRTLYPEYKEKEVPGEIIIPANSEKHDIILITEGDSLNIWLPNIDNISMSQIEKLEEKLKEISNPEMISVIVATECDGNYMDIPFSTVETLIDYLKNCKKVRKWMMTK